MRKILLIVLFFSNVLFAEIYQLKNMSIEKNISIDEIIEFLQEKLSFSRSPNGIGEKGEYLVKINKITNHKFSFIYRIIYYKVKFGDKIEPKLFVNTTIPLKELNPSKVKIDFTYGYGFYVQLNCKYDKKCIYTFSSDKAGLTGRHSSTWLYTKTKTDAKKIKKALIDLIQKSGGTSEPY